MSCVCVCGWVHVLCGDVRCAKRSLQCERHCIAPCSPSSSSSSLFAYVRHVPVCHYPPVAPHRPCWQTATHQGAALCSPTHTHVLPSPHFSLDVVLHFSVSPHQTPYFPPHYRTCVVSCSIMALWVWCGHLESLLAFFFFFFFCFFFCSPARANQPSALALPPPHSFHGVYCVHYAVLPTQLVALLLCVK